MAKKKKKIVHLRYIVNLCGQQGHYAFPAKLFLKLKGKHGMDNNYRLCHKCKYILKNKTKSFNKTGKQNVN
jgi:hypothetical protein